KKMRDLLGDVGAAWKTHQKWAQELYEDMLKAAPQPPISQNSPEMRDGDAGLSRTTAIPDTGERP
ncbi:hypothetical protein, partial [Roseomonas mucosa]|uniref:hypothetical protein n=2 Tax=Roseomonas TaxID=125216 RepID=UPI0028CDD851